MDEDRPVGFVFGNAFGLPHAPPDPPFRSQHIRRVMPRRGLALPVMQRTIGLADSLQGRIMTLGLEQWKQQIFGLIFLDAYNSTPTPNHAEQVHTLLAKLEKLEATALLKLAIWKAQCQMDMPKNMTTFLDFVHWQKFGWNGKKEAHRNAAAIDIISSCVKAFL